MNPRLLCVCVGLSWITTPFPAHAQDASNPLMALCYATYEPNSEQATTRDRRPKRRDGGRRKENATGSSASNDKFLGTPVVRLRFTVVPETLRIMTLGVQSRVARPAETETGISYTAEVPVSPIHVPAEILPIATAGGVWATSCFSTAHSYNIEFMVAEDDASASATYRGILEFVRDPPLTVPKGTGAPATPGSEDAEESRVPHDAESRAQLPRMAQGRYRDVGWITLRAEHLPQDCGPLQSVEWGLRRVDGETSSVDAADSSSAVADLPPDEDTKLVHLWINRVGPCP